MKDLIAEMRPKTQSYIRDLFISASRGGADIFGTASINRQMDAYLVMLIKDGFIQYQHIIKGGLCINLTFTRKGLDACLMSKCTKDIRDGVSGLFGSGYSI